MSETVDELKSRCGVYLIVSPTNGRYVGSSKRLDKRFNRYKNYSCSKQSAIYASLKKYGHEKHKFSVLMYCDEVDLLFWERCFGDIYLASANFRNGLNIVLPGYNDVPQMRTKELNDKISKIQIERFKDPLQRQRTSERTKAGFTKEVKERMSKIHSDRYLNPELRKKRSDVRKAFYQRCPDAKIAASKKTKEVMALNPHLREKSKETFAKYYKENPDARKRNEKKVINSNTGEIFSGISKILHLCDGATRRVMQNRMNGNTKNTTPFIYL